jgi:subtilisin family serine protease
MSWGYGAYFDLIIGGRYRDDIWTGSDRREYYGMVGANYWGNYRFVVRVASVDVDIEELTDAGVHVCIAAGNSYQKIDVPGGDDYDNFFTTTSWVNKYYHRGGSPFGEDCLIVGNIDSSAVADSGGLEQKANSSENGPGVSVWAPGTNIMSSTSTLNSFSDGMYPANENFRICNITGTSMASPQVCGVGALMLQANPHATPAQLKAYIIEHSSSNLYSTGSDTDYADSRSLHGGYDRILNNIYSSEFGVRIINS